MQAKMGNSMASPVVEREAMVLRESAEEFIDDLMKSVETLLSKDITQREGGLASRELLVNNQESVESRIWKGNATEPKIQTCSNPLSIADQSDKEQKPKENLFGNLAVTKAEIKSSIPTDSSAA